MANLRSPKKNHLESSADEAMKALRLTISNLIYQTPWLDVINRTRGIAEKMMDVEEEAREWVDDGTLPVDKDGNMPFYFLDAHEGARLPETVYLFGKVSMKALLPRTKKHNDFYPGAALGWAKGRSRRAISSSMPLQRTMRLTYGP